MLNDDRYVLGKSGTVVFVFVVIETERKISIPDRRVMAYSPKNACCFADYSHPPLILDLF